MKTKVEIIEETAAYYSEDVNRRSLDGNKCVYNGPDGKQCAFARVCEKPIDQRQEGTSAWALIKQTGTALLKDEYKINDAAFWDAIQGLHDYPDNWDEKGLTEAGKQRVELLKKTYAS